MVRDGKGRSLLEFPDSFIIIDIETTGLSYDCSIIEMSAIKVIDNIPVDTFTSLIKPEPLYEDILEDGTVVNCYVDAFITSLTGITNEMLEKAESLNVVLPKFFNFVGNSTLMGHNIASFDSNFIYDAYASMGLPTFSNDYVDTIRLSRWLLTELDSHRLSDIAEYYNITSSGAHRALRDCEITLHCYNALKNTCIQKYNDIQTFYAYIKQKRKNHSRQLSAKEIEAQVSDFDESHPVYGKTFVFTGALDRMLRKHAMQLVKNLGGENGDSVTKKTNYLVLGNNDYCKSIKDGKSSKHKKAEKLKIDGYDIEIISEDVFYSMIEAE